MTMRRKKENLSIMFWLYPSQLQAYKLFPALDVLALYRGALISSKPPKPVVVRSSTVLRGSQYLMTRGPFSFDAGVGGAGQELSAS